MKRDRIEIYLYNRNNPLEEVFVGGSHEAQCFRSKKDGDYYFFDGDAISLEDGMLISFKMSDEYEEYIRHYDSSVKMVRSEGLVVELDDATFNDPIPYDGKPTHAYQFENAVTFGKYSNYSGEGSFRYQRRFAVPDWFDIDSDKIYNVNSEDKWMIFESFEDGKIHFYAEDRSNHDRPYVIGETLDQDTLKLDISAEAAKGYKSLDSLVRDFPEIVRVLPVEFFMGKRLERITTAVANGLDYKIENAAKKDVKSISEFKKYIKEIEGYINDKVSQAQAQVKDEEAQQWEQYQTMQQEKEAAQEEEIAKQEKEAVEAARLDRYRAKAEERSRRKTKNDVSQISDLIDTNIRNFGE